jgi:hypothetical protein
VTIVLAGGRGFLGRALATRLARDHRVLTLTRRPRPGVPTDVAWAPDGGRGSWAAALDGADAVVNLAGEGIADRRWTQARKAALLESRLLATRSLVAALHGSSGPPRVFVSSSGVGYYGARGDEPVTEEAPAGTDFLARLAARWEQEAREAEGPLTRVAIVRTGLVLDPHGGALKTMLLPFRLGLGARLGSGRQYVPWIHLADWVALAAWIITTDNAPGAFNATAPMPVTNAEFTRTLARVLRRPAVLRAPSFALKLALGEMGETLLLTGQRALPARAERMGFQFRFRELEPALRDLLR